MGVNVENGEGLGGEEGEELDGCGFAGAGLADQEDGLAGGDAAGEEGEEAAQGGGPGEGGGGGLRSGRDWR